MLLLWQANGAHKGIDSSPTHSKYVHNPNNRTQAKFLMHVIRLINNKEGNDSNKKKRERMN